MPRIYIPESVYEDTGLFSTLVTIPLLVAGVEIVSYVVSCGYCHLEFKTTIKKSALPYSTEAVTVTCKHCASINRIV